MPNALMQRILSDAPPLLGDGAMGTQLMARGLLSGSCGELWNVEHPDRVLAVHQAYRRAGCQCLTTNTFGATRYALNRHGLGGRTDEINRHGAQLARQVAEKSLFVLGDIGPFGDFIEPLGEMTRGELATLFAQQAAALAEGGADALLIETMSDPSEMRVAIEAARQATKLPIIATYAFNRGEGESFRTMMGTSVTEAVAAARLAGADVVGTNCGTSLSLDDYLRLAEQLVQAAGGAPVIVQPNAGSPKSIDGQLIYAATEREMAKTARRLADCGVKMIGGCCGTAPHHLAAMAQELSK